MSPSPCLPASHCNVFLLYNPKSFPFAFLSFLFFFFFCFFFCHSHSGVMSTAGPRFTAVNQNQFQILSQTPYYASTHLALVLFSPLASPPPPLYLSCLDTRTHPTMIRPKLPKTFISLSFSVSSASLESFMWPKKETEREGKVTGVKRKGGIRAWQLTSPWYM